MGYYQEGSNPTVITLMAFHIYVYTNIMNNFLRPTSLPQNL